MRRRFRRLTVLLSIATVAACTSPTPLATDGVDSNFAQLADAVIAQAEAGEGTSGIVASGRQLDILERARGAGDLSWDDVNEAIGNTATCLEASGFWLTMREPFSIDGFEVPSYSWSGPPAEYTPEEMLLVGDPCIAAESYYVESLYASQPRALETSEAWYTENIRPRMVACLEDHGVAVDDDATSTELNFASNEYLQSVLNVNGNDYDSALASGEDCWTIAYDDVG